MANRIKGITVEIGGDNTISCPVQLHEFAINFCIFIQVQSSTATTAGQ